MLRNVSRPLRHVIDHSNFNFEQIKFDIGEYSLRTSFKKKYDPNSGDFDYDTYAVHREYTNDVVEDEFGEIDERARDEAGMKKLLQHMSGILKNSKIRLELLFVNSQGNKMAGDMLKNAFKKKIFKLSQLIQTKRLRMSELDIIGVFSVISLCEPGTLEEIEIFLWNGSANISSVTNLEHWKKGKSIKLDAFWKVICPIENLIHLSRFNVLVHDFTIEDAIYVRDVSFLKVLINQKNIKKFQILLECPHFESGTFKYQVILSEIKDYLQLFEPNNIVDWLQSSVIYETTAGTKFQVRIDMDRKVKFTKINLNRNKVDFYVVMLSVSRLILC